MNSVSKDPQPVSQKHFSIVRRLLTVVAALLMVMVSVLSPLVVRNSKEATVWRKHTVDVIVAGENFQNSLLLLSRNARSYATTGDTNFLTAYHEAARIKEQQLKHLKELVKDNPAQINRLNDLSKALADLITYHDQMNDICRRRGAAAATAADPDATRARKVFAVASDRLTNFINDEETLLNRRSQAEERSYRNVEYVLVTGSSLAALFLVSATVITRRELRLRRQAEARLSRALKLQKAIFDSTEYAIVTTDRQGIIQTFNPAAEQLLGYSATEVTGRATPALWRNPDQLAQLAADLEKKLGRPIAPTFEAVAASLTLAKVNESEWNLVRKDGSHFISNVVSTTLTDENGDHTGYLSIFRDISRRKALELERERLITELTNALAEVKTLSGLIPICGWCKSVRNDSGYWQSVEVYVKSRSDVTFTHGICPACQEKFKADVARTKTQTSQGSPAT